MRYTCRFWFLAAVLLGSLVSPAICSAETFTLAIAPDVQQEITGHPAQFNDRMRWLVENKDALNLKMVLLVGDIANWDTPDHLYYLRAGAGMEILGKARIPYAIALGNHDTAAVKPGGSAAPGNTNKNLRITTTYNTFFPVRRFTRLAGMYQPGKMDNAFHTFEAGGLNWLVLNLELWPRTEVIEWAKNVVQEHPKHNVIILTHAYLTGGSSIQQNNGGYGDNSPQYLFDNLIKPYANVRMVFCGHTGRSGYRTDQGTNGNTIYQFLQCYHDNSTNPVRLLAIDTDNGTMKSHVYCPSIGKEKDDGSAFTVTGVKWVGKN
ncbi:MAG TPA: metallophosphoesterase [Armatimonadota bacterium]|nr:metallophosphoesterase [Armatimonadota bacterium]